MGFAKPALVAAVLALALITMAGFGAYLWGISTGSVALLDFVDARFPRPVAIRQVARVHYGSDPHQKLVVYVPANAPHGAPLVVFIHGGGWRTGNPYEYAFVARALAQQGYATALVGYRLGNKGHFPAMLEDCAAAIGWLLEHRAELRVDTDRLVLAGHSAGAYNAAMLALDGHWLIRAGVPRGTVKGVVGIAGPYDFYPFDTANLRAVFGSVADPQATQPINFVRGDAPPMLLFAGTEDTVVKPRNSRVLATALQQAGAKAEFVSLAGLDHVAPIMRLARPFDRDRRELDALFPFLAAVTHPSAAAPASAAVQPAGR